MPSPDLLYELPGLDHLRPDTLSLGVPVCDDIIQIGVGFSDRTCLGVPEKKRLAVQVEKPEISVSREDERPLQMEDIRAAGDLVLAQPIGRLTLYRTQESGLWAVRSDPELIVSDPEGLGAFLNLVMLFSLSKQDKRPADLSGLTSNPLVGGSLPR